LWLHPVDRCDVGCSIFEQGRRRSILQHHAIAGKLDSSLRALYFSAQTAHSQYSIA
jgi:hypothetical protein